MKIKNIFVIFLFIAFSMNFYAQTYTQKLWMQSVPDSKECVSYKEKLDNQFIKNVVNPELLVYLAPKKKNSGTAVIICPGGGYGFLAQGHEGKDVAAWFNKNGVTAIVLKYRLPSDSIMKDKKVGPLQDAQEAVRVVRRNAKEWGISTSKIGIMGFSAGGHLASTLCTHFNDIVYNSVDTISARPDFSIFIYPVISMMNPTTHMGSRVALLGNNPDTATIIKYSNELQVTSNTPPVFIVHSANDKDVRVANSINYFLAINKYKSNCELHIYQTGGHGYGLARNGKTESQWTNECIHWMRANDL